MSEIRPSIFKQYAKNLLLPDPKKNQATPFKNHPQIQIIIDILSRHKNHHVLLKCTSLKMQSVMLEALAQQLITLHIPKILREAFFIYFDITQFSLNFHDPKQIENDFNNLFDEIRSKSKRMIFVINQIEPLFHQQNLLHHVFYLGKFLKSILTDPQWRLIALTNEESDYPDLNRILTPVIAPEPTEADSLAILKSYRSELELFHHVTISDETVSSAIEMANRYLPGTVSLDKMYELIDSAAARATYAECHDRSTDSLMNKPRVTRLHLAEIISGWTSISLSHLQLNRFQSSPLVEAMQQQIFGQEPALHTITTLLQNASIKLNNPAGPLCSFLWVGPSGTGKRTFAESLAMHLFGTPTSLIPIEINDEITELKEIKIINPKSTLCETLLSAIQKKPYGIVFIEHIDKLSKSMQMTLETILKYGFIFDAAQNKYDFRHAILIMTTTLGAEQIIHLSEKQEKQNKNTDLMQLVLSDHLQNFSNQTTHLSNDIHHLVLSILNQHFSKTLLQNLKIVPFLPLDYSAFEKIIQNKLKTLETHLDHTWGLELTYAPDIIKFLAHEALSHRTQMPLDQLLDQELYACVSHTLASSFEEKNKFKRLLLQLNETAQWLRCEFIATHEISDHLPA